jgi:hypothetical protein
MLCYICRHRSFRINSGTCERCAGVTINRAFPLCNECSKELDKCESCKQRLNPPDLSPGC